VHTLTRLAAGPSPIYAGGGVEEDEGRRDVGVGTVVAGGGIVVGGTVTAGMVDVVDDDASGTLVRTVLAVSVASTAAPSRGSSTTTPTPRATTTARAPAITVTRRDDRTGGWRSGGAAASLGASAARPQVVQNGESAGYS